MAYIAVIPGLLAGVRELLVNASVVRVPNTAGDARGNPPPMWVEPRFGTPAPGEGNDGEVGLDAVVGINYETSIPQPPYQSSVLRQPCATIWIRAAQAPLAFQINDDIAAQINDQRDYWLPNGLWIGESIYLRELQPIGADNTGYTFNCEYRFDVWSPQPVSQ